MDLHKRLISRGCIYQRGTILFIEWRIENGVNSKRVSNSHFMMKVHNFSATSRGDEHEYCQVGFFEDGVTRASA